jgi:hypothetical protein
MAQQDNYRAVLADLREQRKQLDSAILVIERLAGGGRLVTSVAVPSSGDAEIAGQGSFHGLKLPEAVKKYLWMAKRPQTAKQIATGLRASGMLVTSKHFYSNVYTTLSRGERAGEFVQIGKEWGLAEWRPGKGKRPEEQDSEQA